MCIQVYLMQRAPATPRKKRRNAPSPGSFLLRLNCHSEKDLHSAPPYYTQKTTVHMARKNQQKMLSFAAREWGGKARRHALRSSALESVECLFHTVGSKGSFLSLHPNALPRAVRNDLAATQQERFVGVLFYPEHEAANYCLDVSFSNQFDHYLFFDETHTLTPLRPQPNARWTPRAPSQPVGKEKMRR